MPLDEEGVKYTIDVSQASTSVRDLAKDASALAAVLATLDKGTEEVSKDFVEFHSELSKTIPVVEQTTASVAGLNAATKNIGPELDGLTSKLYGAAGTGEGESGVGGFAGVSASVLKAERAFTALTTGHGLARAAPMLEGLVKTIGGPAGLGFAFVAAEMALNTFGPKIATFFKSFNADAIKEVTDELKKALEAADALAATPTMAAKTTAGRVKTAIAEDPGLLDKLISGMGPTTAFMKEADLAKVRHLERYKAAGEPAGKLYGLEEEVQKIETEAAEERIKQAKLLLSELETKREARDQLRQMAKDKPGLISRQFLTELGMAEPEYQVEMRQTIAAETAAGHEMQTTRDHMKKKIKQDKDWQHGVNIQDTVFRQMEKEEDETKKRGNIAEANELLKRQNEEKHAADEARRKAEKAAHEALPTVQTRHDEELRRNQMMGIMRQKDIEGQQQGYAPASPAFLQHATTQALQYADAGINIAAAVMEAIRVTNMKNAADAQRALGQMSQMDAAQWQRMNGNQMFNPTQSNRGDGG